MGQIEESGPGVRICMEEGNGPGSGASADVEQMGEMQGLQIADDCVGEGGCDVVHCFDEGGIVGIGAADAWLGRGDAAGFHDGGQLSPSAEAVGLMLGHGELIAGSVAGEDLGKGWRHGVPVGLFVEEMEGDESIKED